MQESFERKVNSNIENTKRQVESLINNGVCSNITHQVDNTAMGQVEETMETIFTKTEEAHKNKLNSLEEE